jgi:hypothetical protein
MPTAETLPQLVTRLREAKWPSRREADRATGIPYATWQNIEVRGTIPTLETLSRIAEALGVPELVLINAAHASRDARAQSKSPPTVEQAKPLASQRRSTRGTRRGNGSTDQRRRSG